MGFAERTEVYKIAWLVACVALIISCAEFLFRWDYCVVGVIVVVVVLSVVVTVVVVTVVVVVVVVPVVVVVAVVVAVPVVVVVPVVVSVVVVAIGPRGVLGCHSVEGSCCSCDLLGQIHGVESLLLLLFSAIYLVMPPLMAIIASGELAPRQVLVEKTLVNCTSPPHSSGLWVNSPFTGKG